MPWKNFYHFRPLGLYVDDCILARNNLSFLITTKGELSKEFDLTNNGSPWILSWYTNLFIVIIKMWGYFCFKKKTQMLCLKIWTCLCASMFPHPWKWENFPKTWLLKVLLKKMLDGNNSLFKCNQKSNVNNYMHASSSCISHESCFSICVQSWKWALVNYQMNILIFPNSKRFWIKVWWANENNSTNH